MKVLITGDLHLGITDADSIERLAERMSSEEPDAVIVAGDVAEPSIGAWERCLGLLGMHLELNQDRLGVIAGNHDLWHRTGDGSTSLALFNNILPTQVLSAGWTWLEGRSLRLPGGVAIVASICWYDYSSYPLADKSAEVLRSEKGRFNNDGNYMDSEWNDIHFALECRMRLLDELDALEQDSSIKDVMVVTHVPVFREQQVIEPGELFKSSVYFYNFTTGNALKAYGKIRHVVSGHTHRGVQGEVLADDGHAIQVEVLPSDYKKPAYKFIQVDEGLPSRLVERVVPW